MNYGFLAICLVVIGIGSRLIPHAPNIAAISALMLFSGSYLPKRFLWVPFLALLVSDYFIGFYGSDMFWVYGSYFLIGLVGFWLHSHKKPLIILGSSLFSSILFFIITNFGVWAPPNNWYPHSINGLLESYTLALPFFRNSLTSDLIFTIILFGSYELIKRFSQKYLSEKIVKFIF